MEKKKYKTLAKAWGKIENANVIYENDRMCVICSKYHRYHQENAIGIYWKEVYDENKELLHNAYPIQGTAFCPLHLNDDLTLILLEGLNLKKDLDIKQKQSIQNLITYYKNKIKKIKKD